MSEPKEIKREFKELAHPDSDPEEVVHYDNGTSRYKMNMLVCDSPNCPATFKSTRRRAFHIQTAHPGEYSGPNEAMLQMSEILKSQFNDDADLGRTYTKNEL